MITSKVICIFIALALIFPDFLTSIENKIPPGNNFTNYSVGPTYVSLQPYLERNKRVDDVKHFTTDLFNMRHIRKGDCSGIHKKQFGPISFKRDLKLTTGVKGLENTFTNRNKHTYILSMTKSAKDIGKCIGDYIANKLGADDTGKEIDSLYYRVLNHNFKDFCGFPDIKVAYLDIPSWENKKPKISYCTCGDADFKVGYTAQLGVIRVHHFDKTTKLPTGPCDNAGDKVDIQNKYTHKKIMKNKFGNKGLENYWKNYKK